MENSQAPLWTQDQAISYECARDAISDMLTIEHSRLKSEEEKLKPNKEKIAEHQNRIADLRDERKNLSVTNDSENQRIRAEYGKIIREWFSTAQMPSIKP